MNKFLNLLGRFRRDERGAFLALFGILAVVLIAISGAVVDYTSVEQARTRAQVALDAAALALQPSIYTDTTAALKTKAQALLVERVADSRIASTVTSVTKDTVNGDIVLNAQLVVPLYFVRLVGISTMTAQLDSKATRKKLNLEVMMVLDNSNSMSSSSRMTNLISAAKCAANILLNGDCNSTATSTTALNTWIGIVPFTLGVNVGTGNASASWLDRTGAAAATRNNFDSDDTSSTAFTGTVDRVALANQLNGLDWGGCVEARKSPYDTDDTVPTSSSPDTLFTPYFAPDEPDSNTVNGSYVGPFYNDYISDTPAACNYSGSCSYVLTGLSCRSDGTNCSSGTSYSGTLTGSKTGSLSCSCPTSGTSTQTVTGGSGNSSNWTLKRTWTCTYSYPPQGLSGREVQERMCKYTGATPSGVSQASVIGPNGDCPVNAITPLTATKATVTAGINALDPQGGTNIHMGVEWGFHALSPTAPFTEGKAYGTTSAKVMIVMTDGENTAYANNNMNGTQYYSSYGNPWNQRLGNTTWNSTQLETEMDTRTVAACTSAKAAGITIYTVGLSTAATSDQTKVETMLKNCSSGVGYYYFPAAASELTTVFQAIANQLAALRIAQ